MDTTTLITLVIISLTLILGCALLPVLLANRDTAGRAGEYYGDKQIPEYVRHSSDYRTGRRLH